MAVVAARPARRLPPVAAVDALADEVQQVLGGCCLLAVGHSSALLEELSDGFDEAFFGAGNAVPLFFLLESDQHVAFGGCELLTAWALAVHVAVGKVDVYVDTGWHCQPSDHGVGLSVSSLLCWLSDCRTSDKCKCVSDNVGVSVYIQKIIIEQVL